MSDKDGCLSPRQTVRVAAAFLQRWGELASEEAMRDFEAFETLGQCEQYYLSAYWSERMDAAVRYPDRLPVPFNDAATLDKAWLTICKAYHWDPFPADMAPDVKNRLEWMKRQIAEDFERGVKKTIAAANIASPIEQIFVIEWKYERVEERLGLRLEPQKAVETPRGTFSIDFVVSRAGSGNALTVAIELDGHDFHEKTKEQAEHDKRRERAVVSAGIPVLRFTGGEVYKNPRAVIREVLEFVQKHPDPAQPFST